MSTKLFTLFGTSISTAILLVLCISIPASALAQGGDPTSFGDGLNTIKEVAGENELGEGRSAKEILQNIVKWLLSLVGTIAVISLVYGGFLYITSQGDDNKAEKAKTLILYSVIGLIIIGLSAIIVNVVIDITQV